MSDQALLMPATTAFAAIGVGRTKGFELLAEGRIRARKLGSRTLIEVESLREFVASLPVAGAQRAAEAEALPEDRQGAPRRPAAFARLR